MWRRLRSRFEERRASSIRFSIVLPMFNSPPDHLRTQLESIAAQTHPSFECIVIDDGSDDSRGADVAQTFADRDQRFVIHRRDRNGGIAAATNDGLDRATGDWIVFCDHDDVLYTWALATLATHIAEHPDDDVVYSDEQLIDEHGGLVHEYRKPDFSPERLLANNYMCHVVTVRRRLVETIGRLDTASEPAADRDFNFRATHAARSVGHVPEILYGWRAIPGSVALALTEKPDVERSQLLTAQAHLTRTRSPASASIRPGGQAIVTIEYPRVAELPTIVDIEPSTSPDHIDAAIRAATTRFVVLAPAGCSPEDEWIAPLTAQCARPGVGAAGPRLVTSDGRLVSAGRTHHPVVADVLQGADAEDHGPWGAFLASREVASISPIGATFDRQAVIDAGGFDVGDVDTAGIAGRCDVEPEPHFDRIAIVDVTMAALCTRLRLAGLVTIWTPQSTLLLPSDTIRADQQFEIEARAVVQRHLAAGFPEINHDPYSPLGSHR